MEQENTTSPTEILQAHEEYFRKEILGKDKSELGKKYRELIKLIRKLQSTSGQVPLQSC